MRDKYDVRIKVISKAGALPKYETPGSAGFDLSAYLSEPVTLKSGERALIPTGIYLEIPEGYEAQVRARSGLAVKYGVGLVNGVGTIDSDYRGEVKVPLINWGEKSFVVENGDRIAQVVIAKYEQAKLELTDALSSTSRGEGGFGHTGV